MKKIILAIIFAVGAFANTLTIGDTIPNIKFNDQFDKVNSIKADTKTIIFAESKDKSTVVKEFLISKGKGFLENNKAEYVADISGMPSLISKFFALPKMRKYDFSILLLNEENKDLFSSKEDKISIYTIVDSKVTDIKYISSKEELAKAFK